MFKVGDKVKVKQLVRHKSYDGLSAAEAMVKMSGSILTIRHYSKSYRFFYVEENNFAWSKDMFEDKI